jgi:hypothetical protein
MRVQRFGAHPPAGPRGSAIITVPFDPDQAYLRWIDATTRRPDLRAARIAEAVDLLASGIKQRPRSQAPPAVTR